MSDLKEEIIRGMLAGFVADPPDSDYQQGFLGSTIMIAQEVIGIRWDDPLLQQAEALFDGSVPAAQPTLKKAASHIFTVLDGGRP